MKVLILILILIFPATAQEQLRLHTRTAAASACTTIHEELHGTKADAPYFGDTVRPWAAYPLFTTNTVDACAISLALRLGLAEAATYYIRIYSNNAGSPGTQIGAETIGTAFSALTGSFTTNKYLLTATIPAGTNWVVFRITGASVNTYAYPQAVTSAPTIQTLPQKVSTDGTTWIPGVSSYPLWTILWK